MPTRLFDLYLKVIQIFPTPAAIKVRSRPIRWVVIQGELN
jgi:hypothetical protein